MYLASRILGETAVTRLRESSAAAVLTIGRDVLTRADLAAIGCFNFTAARILSAVVREELPGVKTLKQLYDEVPPSALALPHLGVISLAVLGAAFEARGVGGATPLENWVAIHKAKPTTWHTMKAREVAEHAKERQARKARKAARRDRAHGLRVERFETRRAG